MIFLSGHGVVAKITMPLAPKNVVGTLLFITILLITVINVYGAKEKRLDLKIGFDLVSGPNGVPSLRIRDFEESQEPNARAYESNNENKETTTKKGRLRADSFSDSNEQEQNTGQPSKETTDDAKSNEDAKSDDDDDDNSSGEHEKISTRGLRADEYEPEENPSIHKQQDLENDSDKDGRRRQKRHALFETFVKQQRKWRKFV